MVGSGWLVWVGYGKAGHGRYNRLSYEERGYEGRVES